MNRKTLFTKVKLPTSTFKIDYTNPIVLMGSCFAENLGKQLQSHKFNVLTNPFGIIYNPISIVNNLKRIINYQPYTKKDLFQYQQKWLSFNHHGSFSSLSQDDCLTKINTALLAAHTQLKKSTTLFITFGSAWVYEYSNIGVVANCHKMPNKLFTKRLLSVKEIDAALNELSIALRLFNPKINIIFTVSPVRHTKDGLHENSLSKSTLHLSIKNSLVQNNNCHYFPAYEIVIDELRDYRFFKDDFVHPTELAVKYIWEKVTAVYCKEETCLLIEKIQKINQAIQHVPFDFNSKEHQQFIKKQITLMEKLTQQYPFLNFEKEKTILSQQSDSLNIE